MASERTSEKFSPPIPSPSKAFVLKVRKSDWIGWDGLEAARSPMPESRVALGHPTRSALGLTLCGSSAPPRTRTTQRPWDGQGGHR
eukprot:6178907-Pleurochrysis_carterae.AAC.1